MEKIFLFLLPSSLQWRRCYLAVCFFAVSLFPLLVYSQNVGIGTNTPAFKLDVTGRMRVKTGTLNNVSTSSGVWMEDYRDGSNRFFVGMQDSIRFGLYGEGVGSVGWGLNFNARTGNLGIGRTAGSSRLEIADPNGGDISFYKNTTFSGRVIGTDTTLEIYSGYGSNNCIPDPCPAKNLVLIPPVNLLTGSVPGNVGIGINDPQDKLEVKGNLKLFAPGNSSGSIIRMYGGASDLSYIQFYKDAGAPVSMGYLGYSGSGDYSIWYRGTATYLNSDGLGISTSAPLTKLHIVNGQDAGLANTTNGYLMLGSGTSTNIIFDNNEIMARNNGAVAPLTLQNDGGSVRIGNVAAPSGYLFAVKGKAICEELKVQLSGNWPDYVFHKNYQLKSFDELRQYIAENNHLPNIPAAAELEKNGMEVGDMQKKMMEKIEELTLYVLKLEEQVREMKKIVSSR
jgi:hypothetical protein